MPHERGLAQERDALSMIIALSPKAATTPLARASHLAVMRSIAACKAAMSKTATVSHPSLHKPVQEPSLSPLALWCHGVSCKKSLAMA